MTLLEAELAGLPVFICDPDMKEVVAEGGYLLANGPSAKQMAGALDYLYKHPEMVKKMSETMIAHRKEVLQSEKIKGLLQIYKAQ
jgi:glycosyltransferase involved in cell wall biosynthesis